MGERTTQPFAIQVLDRLMPLKGSLVIDVAAGTGGLAVAAAERGANVLATDINPAMIERTRQRLQPFTSCSAGLMDFRSLTADDATFDTAISNFGVLAYPEWRQGLAEMLRVTRPEGCIALVMWTHGYDCSPAHLMKRVVNELFPTREVWPSGMFPVFSEDGLVSHLRDAGCSDVDVQVVCSSWSPFLSPNVVAECAPMFMGFPGYASLTRNELDMLHPSLEAAFHRYADDAGVIRLPTKAFLVIARKS